MLNTPGRATPFCPRQEPPLIGLPGGHITSFVSLPLSRQIAGSSSSVDVMLQDAHNSDSNLILQARDPKCKASVLCGGSAASAAPLNLVRCWSHCGAGWALAKTVCFARLGGDGYLLKVWGLIWEVPELQSLMVRSQIILCDDLKAPSPLTGLLLSLKPACHPKMLSSWWSTKWACRVDPAAEERPQGIAAAPQPFLRYPSKDVKFPDVAGVI